MSDADWAVKHSTTGYIFKHACAAVTWASKKQASVALSSCEAEIMAASEGAKEAVYLSSFLTELGAPLTKPVEMGCDNRGAIDLAYNPEHHQRTKHIDRRHFYVRELVEEMKLRVPFVATADNWADFFTKPLKSKQFYALRDTIMNVAFGDRAARVRDRTSRARRAACREGDATSWGGEENRHAMRGGYSESPLDRCIVSIESDLPVDVPSSGMLATR